jgi:hypothetical protein
VMNAVSGLRACFQRCHTSVLGMGKGRRNAEAAHGGQRGADVATGSREYALPGYSRLREQTMNDEDLARTQAQLDDALARLEALVRECQGLFARTRVLAGLPPLDAVDHLLQRLGDEGPVDDFEAGRRRDRRLLPRHERRPRHQ